MCSTKIECLSPICSLFNKVAQLTIECVVLLRRRMAEVGVNFDSESDFSRTVIQICSRIKELEEQNRQLQDEVVKHVTNCTQFLNKSFLLFRY